MYVTSSKLETKDLPTLFAQVWWHLLQPALTFTLGPYRSKCLLWALRKHLSFSTGRRQHALMAHCASKKAIRLRLLLQLIHKRLQVLDRKLGGSLPATKPSSTHEIRNFHSRDAPEPWEVAGAFWRPASAPFYWSQLPRRQRSNLLIST